jgi:putative ABC transport system permease protein
VDRSRSIGFHTRGTRQPRSGATLLAGSFTLGDHIRIFDGNGVASGDALEIVGVVDDVKGSSIAEPAPPRLYRSLMQTPSDSVALALRVHGDATAVAGSVRGTLRAIDSDLAIAELEPMDAAVKAGVRNMELVLGLFVSFGAVALLLAAAGVYGVTRFSVGQRRHEIGVRIALGATARDVVRLILARSVRLILIGVGLGLAGGMAIARLMGSVLFGISAVDPLTYAIVTALVGTSGVIATYLPAHRATRVDPLTALRAE